MLELLSQVCDAVAHRTAPPLDDAGVGDYKDFLRILDWRIRTLPIPEVADEDFHSTHDETLVLQLYRIAMAVFLDQASEGLLHQAIKRQAHIDRGFSIFPRLGSCKQQFPIFVLGCEARTDAQRAVILDIISRTEKMDSSRSFTHCKAILQTMWAQDDLAHGIDIGYRDKLTSAMSQCVIVPIFV